MIFLIRPCRTHLSKRGSCKNSFKFTTPPEKVLRDTINSLPAGRPVISLIYKSHGIHFKRNITILYVAGLGSTVFFYERKKRTRGQLKFIFFKKILQRDKVGKVHRLEETRRFELSYYRPSFFVDVRFSTDRSKTDRE